ncbi:MAG: pyridoxal 5'-phosphate synthase glutaminase subunit PdxT [Alphaproteobacteria bacterium]
MAKPVIGVLALQGAVEPHRKHIEAAGGEFRAVKTPEQFETVDAFILPGGESTTMLKLIEAFDLWDALAAQFKAKPVWGICAGSILIAENVTSPAQKSFGLIPMTVERNAYGRQLESHHADINGYDVSLIRAPVISKTGDGVEVEATHEGKPVWVEKGRYMATTFHPELTLDYPSPMHREFVNLVREYGKKAA